MTASITLEDMARQAIDGDREALESLVRLLQADIYGLSLRILWNREDAEDATQEILVRIVTRLSQFDFRSRLKTWPYRVAVNFILDTKKSAIERLHLSFERFADDLTGGLQPAAPDDTEHSVLIEEVKVACTTAMLQCLDRPHRLGLKLLGMPVVESPRPGLIRRLCGISRLRRDLEDLEVAQCLFAGDEVTNPHHVGIIANGDGINVHHCLFRGLKISAVYRTPGSKGHAMTDCLCHDLYGSGVWTAGIANDFEYRNNVVEGCNYVWTAQGGSSALADAAGRGGQQAGAAPTKPPEPVHYRVVDSFFSGNRRLAGSGTGARLEYVDIDPSFLELIGTKVTDQPVVLERDSTQRGYLHLVAGSEAAKVGAGLFTKPFA
jgi:RNA polymerase sigma factor (sigma-70 family)